MQSKIALLTLVLFLSGCGIGLDTSAGVCRGLDLPIDQLAKALVEADKATPDAVVIAGGKVIIGYDKGCK
jgi:hypothetical protein